MVEKVKQLEEIYSLEFAEHLHEIALEHYNNVASFKRTNVGLFEGYQGSLSTEASFDSAIQKIADDYETAASNFTEVENYNDWLSAVHRYREAESANRRVFNEMCNILNNAGAFSLMRKD